MKYGVSLTERAKPQHSGRTAFASILFHFIRSRRNRPLRPNTLSLSRQSSPTTHRTEKNGTPVCLFPVVSPGCKNHFNRSINTVSSNTHAGLSHRQLLVTTVAQSTSHRVHALQRNAFSLLFPGRSRTGTRAGHVNDSTANAVCDRKVEQKKYLEFSMVIRHRLSRWNG